MRREASHDPSPAEEHEDIELPNGCILCGGPLAMRLRNGAAGTFCASCRWISHPHMKREDGAVHVIHPAGGLA
jgi:hypothetical protein